MTDQPHNDQEVGRNSTNSAYPFGIITKGICSVARANPSAWLSMELVVGNIQLLASFDGEYWLV